MINTSTLKRFACLTAMAAAFVLVGGSQNETSAQRDPFKKAGWATPKKAPNPSAAKTGTTTTTPVNYGPPAIEARIEYYKRLRDSAAASGAPLPKVTSVLTLNEMAVTGIFKTPRGYAAMVEATPIKLSYTIYPGEKFSTASWSQSKKIALSLERSQRYRTVNSSLRLSTSRSKHFQPRLRPRAPRLHRPQTSQSKQRVTPLRHQLRNQQNHLQIRSSRRLTR